MITVRNSAFDKFVAQLGDELLLAQVIVRRAGRAYELRHEADRARPSEELRLVPVPGLRALAQSTAAGAFRPLKSAPNLSSGWRTLPPGDAELEEALNHLYPGAVTDWFAAQQQPAPVTHYREFTERQSGIYRITTMLTDAQAAQMARACCHRRFCLKRRLWTVGGLEPDTAKSLIPCLEPCAILLEFARKAMRLEQEEKTSCPLVPGEVETLRAALETALNTNAATEREADFNLANNPRRLQLALEKLSPHTATVVNSAEPSDSMGV